MDSHEGISLECRLICPVLCEICHSYDRADSWTAMGVVSFSALEGEVSCLGKSVRSSCSSSLPCAPLEPPLPCLSTRMRWKLREGQDSLAEYGSGLSAGSTG